MRSTWRIPAWLASHRSDIAIGATISLGIVALWWLLDRYLQPTGFDERVEAINAANSLATLAAIVIGGVWAYVKILRRREHLPRLQFTVDVAFVGEQHDRWLVELRALVNNDGFVRHVIRTFSFDLRCLYPDDELADGGPEIGHQTALPHLLKDGSWMPFDWESTFIEPGQRTRYDFVTSVPSRASFVLLHGWFAYGDEGSATHTAQCLVRVPSAGSAGVSPSA